MNFALFFLLVILFSGAIVVLLLGIVGFLVALWKKDNGVADVLYGWHFTILAMLSALVTYSLAMEYGISAPLSSLLAFLVCLWGIRLSARIYFKNKGKPEDFRYADWRAKWKWFKLRSFFQIYVLQGIIALVISTPIVLTIMLMPQDLTVIYALGVFMWLVGFLFEVIGDMQLDRFLKSPESKGKLMTSGLWKFSRHPNYFGEALMWWGFWVVSLSDVGDIWFVTIISPLLITFLLLKVSGVPLLEARMSKHADWAEYAKKTSVFIPWFPKKSEVA